MTHVALLRGINVAGKNLLPMKALAVLFAEAGCRDVQTYIQSGNVLFAAPQTLARRVPGLLGDAIEKRFGFRPAIVLRTADELVGVARSNPFLRDGIDDKTLHVAFLADAPGDRAAALDPARSPPDSFLVRGREIYLHCPNGMGRTKLSNDYFDSKLGTISTMRNWRTVLELLKRAGG